MGWLKSSAIPLKQKKSGLQMRQIDWQRENAAKRLGRTDNHHPVSLGCCRKAGELG